MNAQKPPLAVPPQIAHAAINRLLRPLARFLHIESASGIVLMACTAIALGLANSPWADVINAFWHTHIGITVGSWKLDESLAHWVNDGLMTIFFFVVGLEIKREVVDGELRSFKKAALPLSGAVGGMIAPAAIFLLLQGGREAQRGWGIPMATDIAFAVGILALLGKRVPQGLKIFLLALAIADDIGAILVIALFYSTNVSIAALGIAAIGLAIIAAMNRLGVRSIAPYVFVGIGIWLAMYYSGIHPTIAGVVLGLMTPGRAWLDRQPLSELLLDALDRLDGKIDRRSQQEQVRLVGTLTITARETVAPLERLEMGLHPWVAFAIMPIFALANAGVAIEPTSFQGVSLAVAAGLTLGKPIGIMFFSWLAVRTGMAQLPLGVTWKAILGTGCLAGVGFTMSLFVANLGLEGKLLDGAKIGVLAGSAVSAVLGLVVLWTALPRAQGPMPAVTPEIT
jgi:NhaA family Na+:H+ antiporter